MYHSPFVDLLRELPDSHVVCKEDKKTLLAAELLEKSTSLAHYLQKKGIKKGDHVLMACANGAEFLIVFMALIHLRAKVALVDPHMGNALYKAKVKQFEPKFAFIDSRLLLLQEHPFLRAAYKKWVTPAFYIPFSRKYKRFATGMWLPILQLHERLAYPKDYLEIWKDSSDEDELVLVYTSGTLAEPKAVVHTVGSLYASMLAIAHIFPKHEQARIVTHLPQFALIGMITGYETLFWKENLNAESKINFIEKNKITALFGPPAEYWDLIKYCKAHKRKFPASLQYLFFGSAPVLPSFLQEIRQYTTAKITCLYGMTENLVVCSVDGDEKLKYHGEGDLLGKPLANIKYKIQEDGELLIQSELLFKRYFHLKEREEWYPTGDLVKMDASGDLLMMGRKKNMIIRRHKNIYPGLYEPLISRIPGVKEAVMLGIYNEGKHDEEVILVLEGDPVESSKLKKHLESGPYAIDSDAQPDHILWMKIPKSGRQQKTDILALQKLVKEKLKL